ncbi:MAG: hypothetical protein H7242_06610 [Microbacteriaceae bacterium]|nr:hypothetical protein [Burkholderiaceae bacterium]
MILKWQFNLLTVLGTSALLLVLSNALLFTQNRNAQRTLGQGQQFVQQTVPLEGLYRDIARALAEMAVKGNDRQVLDMLATQGLSVTVNGTAGAAKGDK